MRFLVDAQLPARLVAALEAAGHDAVHTSQMPDGNRSTDRQIAEKADAEGRVAVKLLVVATGNNTNNALLDLFGRAWDAVVEALAEVDFIELHPDALVVHEHRSE